MVLSIDIILSSADQLGLRLPIHLSNRKSKAQSNMVISIAEGVLRRQEVTIKT
jgi:hypothetical protein